MQEIAQGCVFSSSLFLRDTGRLTSVTEHLTCRFLHGQTSEHGIDNHTPYTVKTSTRSCRVYTLSSWKRRRVNGDRSIRCVWSPTIEYQNASAGTPRSSPTITAISWVLLALVSLWLSLLGPCDCSDSIVSLVQALQLLEYLVKHGSERVVDDARSHISTIKMLRSFHYIDDKGKDQGINGEILLTSHHFIRSAKKGLAL